MTVKMKKENEGIAININLNVDEGHVEEDHGQVVDDDIKALKRKEEQEDSEDED